MYWINKTCIKKTWSNITKIYDQVIKKRVFFLGFIGSEYDKHDFIGTVMFYHMPKFYVYTDCMLSVN